MALEPNMIWDHPHLTALWLSLLSSWVSSTLALLKCRAGSLLRAFACHNMPFCRRYSHSFVSFRFLLQCHPATRFKNRKLHFLNSSYPLPFFIFFRTHHHLTGYIFYLVFSFFSNIGYLINDYLSPSDKSGWYSVWLEREAWHLLSWNLVVETNTTSKNKSIK